MMNDDDHFTNDTNALPSSIKSEVRNPIVVGIGASAGGVEAFEAFFKNMASDTGLALCARMGETTSVGEFRVD